MSTRTAPIAAGSGAADGGGTSSSRLGGPPGCSVETDTSRTIGRRSLRCAEDRRGEGHAVVLRPWWSQPCPRTVEHLVGPLPQERRGVALDVLGVEQVNLPAAVACEVGEDLAVHHRVGVALIRDAALGGDVVGKVGGPRPQRDRGCLL